MSKILIIEDEMTIVDLISFNLKREGFEIDAAYDGVSGLEKALSGWADLILLDVMLPGMNGFDLLQKLRQESDVPVIMVTAREEERDKVFGLETGADDYMTKPFSPAELMAHLRALTRRQGDILFERINAGDLTLDLESYDLSRGSKTIHLSFKEFSICKILMANPGQVISKETLIAKAWGVESSAGDNNVEAYISFLRKKLIHLGSSNRIETIRKAGYRIVVNAGAAADANANAEANEAAC